MTRMRMIVLFAAGCAATVQAPAPRHPHVPAPRCVTTIDVSGAAGSSGIDGLTGAPGELAGARGNDGEAGDSGAPGDPGPFVDVALGMRGAPEHPVARISADGHRTRELALDPTCPPIEIRARGGAGGDGGDGGNGGAGGVSVHVRSSWPAGPDGDAGDGGDGGNGGRGGRVVVRYDERHPELLSRISIDARGGEGGAGGSGRNGRAAGTAGDSGADAPPEYLPVAPQAVFLPPPP